MVYWGDFNVRNPCEEIRQLPTVLNYAGFFGLHFLSGSHGHPYGRREFYVVK